MEPESSLLYSQAPATKFNIQKFYMALALRWVFCTDIRTDSDFCFIHHWLIAFITVVERIYSAVRTDSLYTADYVSSLKGYSLADILEVVLTNLVPHINHLAPEFSLKF